MEIMMEEVKVRGLTLKNIKVNEASGYNGMDILFTIQDQQYNFMIAKTNPIMPLNILHRFSEKSICHVCNRTIYPYPVGNQPCLELKKLDKLILDKLIKFLPVK
ncbi:hypothetical protein HPT25_10985 [Bacillus sp. BRMEA1]|uniref:hypothetical protein n=1 Tax=Neobacillus endophyticus TaxID=2738405 RepID=UPI0015639A00|nr:hypothetical protein [Neobacillus endophyticus]NRD77907.1 hypothetical protein [Neobacillus endophyticus]